MKKLLVLIFGFVICTNLFAQNEVLEIPLQYKSIFYSNKQALTVLNEKTGELVLLIEDSNKINALLLSRDMEIISELETEGLKNAFRTKFRSYQTINRTFIANPTENFQVFPYQSFYTFRTDQSSSTESFLGYQINTDDSYSIFFKHSSNKKFGELNLNFQTKSCKFKTLDFKLENEIYVESISNNNTFYLMSVIKNSNDVNFYGFENGNLLKKGNLSFDFLEEKSTKGYLKKAGDILKKGIVKMDNAMPNGIEIASEPNKLYIIDNKFVFTFDNKKNKTEVLTIYPDDFKMTLVEFSKPKIDIESEFTNHNSYIYDNKIFQIKSSSNHLKFEIKDFKTKHLLKEIKLAKEDSITFKNTPIIQVGGDFGGTRELEKTSKFLRKVSQGDIGISVYKQNGIYKISLGSELIINNSGGMAMGGFGGMPIGGASMGASFVGVNFNPTFYAYNGYSSTKTTHIDCLFNGEFNHIEGEIPNNVFDDIKDFEKTFPEVIKSTNKPNTTARPQKVPQNTISGKPKLKNIFHHNGKLYFSYLDVKDRNYHVVEFEKD